MAPPSLAIIILAAGPEIWAFPSWKTRTKEVLLPFYPEATSDSTSLQSWQLTLLRKFARRIRDIDNYRGRMKYIQHGHKSDPKLLHAPDMWTAWLNPLLESWNIVADVEDILIKFHRHPSQLQPLPERVSLVSPLSTLYLRPSESPRLISLQRKICRQCVTYRRGVPFRRRHLRRSHGAPSLYKA